MQLFAHLLSSYLQGMGDFFSALFPAGVTMPAVVIFNREIIVVMGGCGITIYRDFYAFAATLWAKNL